MHEVTFYLVFTCSARYKSLVNYVKLKGPTFGLQMAHRPLVHHLIWPVYKGEHEMQTEKPINETDAIGLLCSPVQQLAPL